MIILSHQIKKKEIRKSNKEIETRRKLNVNSGTNMKNSLEDSIINLK